MRITAEMRNGGVTESGLTLFDKEGNCYHWITKHYQHPLFFALKDEYFKVRMTVTENNWGQKLVKNVRIINK